jgi:hypothetical protein
MYEIYQNDELIVTTDNLIKAVRWVRSCGKAGAGGMTIDCVTTGNHVSFTDGMIVYRTSKLEQAIDTNELHLVKVENVQYFETVEFESQEWIVWDTEHKTDHVTLKNKETGGFRKLPFGTIVVWFW